MKFLLIERDNLPPIILMTAAHQIMAAVGNRRYIGGPVNEGRQARRGREGEPHRRHLVEPPPLDHSIQEVGRADGDGACVLCLRPDQIDQIFKRLAHPAGDIAGGRGLDRANHFILIDKNRIRVRSADIYANALHENFPLKY